MRIQKLKILLAGSLAVAMQGLAAREPAAANPGSESPVSHRHAATLKKTPVIPLSEPPQDLIDEDGKVELDLVDPFQRGREKTAGEGEESGGLSATSLGEISEEFRILAIVIPDNASQEPMALIRLQNESSPQVVRKDDLVQIKRRSPDRRQPAKVSSTGKTSPGEPSFAESALNALEGFSFYLHIKDIQPNHIEAYQKKSPNETIILRW